MPVNFNPSQQSMARLMRGADLIWPQDAPHNAADVKKKMWDSFAAMVRQAEQREAEKQRAEPDPLPME